MLSTQEYLLSTDELALKVNTLENNDEFFYKKQKELYSIYFDLQTQINYLTNKLSELNPNYQTDVIISQIEEINYLEDFEYNGSMFNDSIVKLVGNSSKFYLHCRKNIKLPKVNDFISHKIVGDTIKEWKKFK
jgi:hypothetical protein